MTERQNNLQEENAQALELEQEKVSIAKEKLKGLRADLERIKKAQMENPDNSTEDYKSTSDLIKSRIESLEEVVRRTEDKIKKLMTGK